MRMWKSQKKLHWMESDGRVLDMTVKLKVTDEFKKFTIKLAADETYAFL